MKKAVLAICATMVIFSCSALTPVTVNAARNACPPHVWYLTEEASDFVFIYSHQYLIENGAQGPVWGTCRVYREDKVIHPKCAACGTVDYSTELSRTPYYMHHWDCGSASIPY